jgi:hypothetical protein
LLFTNFDGFIIKLSQYIEKHNIKFGVQETLALQALRTPSKSGKLFHTVHTETQYDHIPNSSNNKTSVIGIYLSLLL